MRRDRDMENQNKTKNRIFFWKSQIWKSRDKIENIPSLQAALESGQDTYTHSPFSFSPALNCDSQVFSFHSEGQIFSILLIWVCLVSYIVTSILFFPDTSNLLWATHHTVSFWVKCAYNESRYPLDMWSACNCELIQRRM